MKERVKVYIEKFDRGVERLGTSSVKWDNVKNIFGEDVLPLWVADTDFPCPDEVIEAIRKKAEHGVYGYSYPTEEAYQSVIHKLKADYDWDVKKEWIQFIDGIVGGLYTSVEAYSEPGAPVIIQSPVYFPFGSSIREQGRKVDENELILSDGKYRMDLEGLLKKDGKLLILCNPHNPVGRVWTKQELYDLGKVCREKGITVVADEIHCEILLNGKAFTPFATVDESFLQNSITFMAASKTYNVAGFHQSYAIIPNPELRKKFLEKRVGRNWGNGFGLTALVESYQHGADYKEAMNLYLWENYLYFKNFLDTRLKKLKVIEPEGTYLLWVDFSEVGLTEKELKKVLIEECRIGVNDGSSFGGSGLFMRFNMGCPRKTLQEALERMEKNTKIFR